MTGYKWVPWPSAPKVYIDLKRGRKRIATIHRVSTARDFQKNRFGKKWMVVTRFACVNGLPGAYGVVFPTMKAAKEYAEGRL